MFDHGNHDHNSQHAAAAQLARPRPPKRKDFQAPHMRHAGMARCRPSWLLRLVLLFSPTLAFGRDVLADTDATSCCGETWYRITAMGLYIGSMREAVSQEPGKDKSVLVFDREMHLDFKTASLDNHSGYHLHLEFSGTAPYALVSGYVKEWAGGKERALNLLRTGSTWSFESSDVRLPSVFSMEDIRFGRVFECRRPAVPSQAEPEGQRCGLPGDLTLDALLAERRWLAEPREIGDSQVFHGWRWSDGCILRRRVRVVGIDAKAATPTIDVEHVENGRVVVARHSLEHPSRFHSRDGVLELRACDGEHRATGTPVNIIDAFIVARVDRELSSASGRAITLELSPGNNLEVPPGPNQRLFRDSVTGKRRILLGVVSPESSVLEGDRRVALEITRRYALVDDALRKTLLELRLHELEPRKRVAELLKFVGSELRYELVPGTDRIESVVESRRGDCSEFSMLFVALARSHGIPAREVGGLVYAGGDCNGLAEHVWAECALDGVWVAADPTTGSMPASSARIALVWGESASDLRISAPVGTFHAVADSVVEPER